MIVRTEPNICISREMGDYILENEVRGMDVHIGFD
jgi:hypothetical protein